MKFQNPSLNSVLTGRTDERTDERTSRNQYAPHFFKVGGITKGMISLRSSAADRQPFFAYTTNELPNLDLRFKPVSSLTEKC